MTTRELIHLLEEFPEDLPVFFSPDADGRTAIEPRDAVMNLVHPSEGKVIGEGDPSPKAPPGYLDSLVIYPRIVREP
jgi:hypothetical protein